jgi:hypothetical protein
MRRNTITVIVNTGGFEYQGEEKHVLVFQWIVATHVI